MPPLLRRRPPARSARFAALGLVLAPLAGAAAPVAVSAVDGDTVDHVVAPGDTLIGLRDRLLQPGTPWSVIQRLNRVADPRRLKPGSTLRLPLALMRDQPSQAQVPWVSGRVSVQRRGSGNTEALTAGAVLLTGDLVTTGAQSSAAIAFEDGTQLLLRPDSRLLIERITRVQPQGPGRSQLQLESGGADAQVPVPSGGAPRNRVDVRTPVVNLGVRGTDFRAQANGARAQLEVLSGQVAAAPPAARAGTAETRVDGGFGVVASGTGVGRPRALLPAPDTSAVPALVERLPLRLPFAPLAGAKAYRAQVFDADGGALRLDGLFDAAQAQWSDDLPDGRYELRLRAADAEGLEGRDARFAFRVKARPEPPFLSEPRPGAALTTESVRFRWARNASASRYALQVSDTPGFERPRVDRADLTDTEADILLPLGTYHWRVASVRGTDDRGPWSDAQTVLRVPPPPPPPSPPVLAPPQSTSDGLLLAWPKAPREGTRYGVQVSRDPAFTTLLADEVTSQPQYLLRKPEPGTYHIRVRSIDADGLQGPFGSPQLVEVPRQLPWWLLVPALLMLL